MEEQKDKFEKNPHVYQPEYKKAEAEELLDGFGSVWTVCRRPCS